MKLGSHNSLTYLTPKKWYMRFFRFVAKCQSKNYKEQYESGVRMFDIRLRPSENIDEEPTIAHGLMEYSTYDGFMNDFLTYLDINAQEDSSTPIYVRFIYERDKNCSDKQEDNFITLCKQYQDKFKSLHFIGGNRKGDWKQVVKLETSPCYLDLYSSMTWKTWDDWFPWLYAKFMNKRNIDNFKDSNCILLIDFI